MFKKNMLKIEYIAKDLSNPDSETLRLSINNNNFNVILSREELRDYELIYDKFALREYEYFSKGIERPDYFYIQLTIKEVNTIITEYKISDKDKELFWLKFNLLLIDIEIKRKDPNSEYYKPPILNCYDENKFIQEDLILKLKKDIQKYKLNKKES